MIVYADTSALAKLLLEERGSTEMVAIIRDAERLVSAAIAYVELRAALAAAFRLGRIRPPLRDNFMAVLERLWSNTYEVAVDRALLRQAGNLAEQMRLRAYDAVHLAALCESGEPGDLAFACWDGDLRNAARELGYHLVPLSRGG